MEPTRLLLAGDTHGNPNFLLYLYERALELRCDAIVQLGDYGYWEHHRDGWAWLDINQDLAEQTSIPLAWIDGNHENHPLLWKKYASSSKTPEGFWEIRNGVFYIPRGTRWSWGGRTFVGLGGAASIDKAWRIKRYNQKTANLPAGMRVMFESWWPTEEIRDEDVRAALADPAPVDVLLCHDKPRAATPARDWSEHASLIPNQEKVQTVVRTLQPKLVVHGHLHRRYTDVIRIGDGDNGHCRIEGLAHDGTKKAT